MNAAIPPAFCASATTCSATVVLPDDSGPKISMMRPRGNPPTPSALSSEMEPVEIAETGTMASFDPSRTMEPLPNCFSICPSVRLSVRERSFSSMMGRPSGDSFSGEKLHCTVKNVTGAGCLWASLLDSGVDSRPVASAVLYDGIRVFRHANLQRVKAGCLGGWWLKAKQVIIMNLVRDALQAVIKASLGGEIDVLSAGERRKF